MAGKTAKCPHCGEKVRIPDPNNPDRPSRPSRSGGAQRPERPQRRRRPERDDVYEAEEVGGADDFDFGGGDDFDFGGFDPNAGAAVSRPDRKPCPACGEMIQKKAAKCRYCGEVFDPALKRRKTKSRKRSRSRSNYSDDDELDTAEWLLIILCNGIGCIMGIVYLIQGKSKAGKMIGYSILSGICWRLLWFLIFLIAEGAGR